MKLKRISLELSRCIYSKNYFNNFLKKNNLPYIQTINKKNFDEFKQEYLKKYSSEPNQISLLGFDLVGLIFYLSKVNNFQLNNKVFDQKNTFKGKIGLFEIEDKRIKHVLNFYKVENNKFKKIF